MRARDTLQEARIVRGLAAGDPEVLGTLFEAYSERVYRFAVRMVGNRDDAEDIVTETFLRIQRRGGEFEVRPDASLQVWIFRIARNLCHDRMRRRQPLPLKAEIVDMSTMDQLDLQLAVRSAVGALPLEFREPIILCDLEGMSVDDAACILGLTRPAMKTRLYKSRRELRDALVGISASITD